MADNGNITSAARAVLEYLAARAKQAQLARDIGEWTDQSLPRTQAALGLLRRLGYVRYFDGHPGSWSVTPAGYRQIHSMPTPDRYRMALEAILTVEQDLYGKNARGIATKALNG